MIFGRSLVILLAFVAVGGASAANNKPTSSGNYCQACKSIVSFAQRLNSSDHRAEYKDVLVNFCELYNPASSVYKPGPCSIFVSGFYVLMDHMDPIHHCDQIGACGSNTDDSFRNNMMIKRTTTDDAANLQMPPRASNIVCEYCEQIVEQTQATLTDPKNIDTIKRQVGAFCDYMQVIGEDLRCRQVANRYLQQALDFIKSIDPLGYCRSISLCGPSAKGKHSKSTLNQLPTLTDFNNFGIETSVSIGERPSAVIQASNSRNNETNPRSSANYSAGPSCTICKTVVKEMFKFLRENKTEENIMLGLNRVCKLIYSRGPKLEQCDDMVKAYTRELIQLLIDETDPEMICMLLGECDHHQTYARVETVGAELNPEKFGLSELITALDPSIEYKSNRACLECKLFISYLKNTLEEPSSQEFLKEWLHQHLCADLSGNLAAQCDQMVDEYSQIFFKAVVGSLDPKSACTELQVCPKASFGGLLVVDASSDAAAPSIYRQKQLKASSPLQPTTRPVARVTGQMCDQCVSIISQIDDYLSTHSIDNDVSVLIENVCNKMPEGALRNECTLIIRSFGSEIVQLIANMQNPRELCTKILLC